MFIERRPYFSNPIPRKTDMPAQPNDSAKVQIDGYEWFDVSDWKVTPTQSDLKEGPSPLKTCGTTTGIMELDSTSYQKWVRGVGLAAWKKLFGPRRFLMLSWWKLKLSRTQ